MLVEQTIDIGHYARVPYHVATAKISSRARDVWTLLAMNCTPENPEVWIRQGTLAEQLHCSTDTTCRATQELVKKGLLLSTQQWHQGRYKIYRLVWEKTYRMNAAPRTADLPDDVPQKCVSEDLTCRTDAVPPAADLREDVPQKCPLLNRVLIKQEQNKEEIFFNSQADVQTQNLMSDWGEVWKKRFQCLDGLSGRPSIETCIEQAMSHESRHKYASQKVWCEMWLQNAARMWLVSFNREQNAPATDPNLDAEAKARRSKIESDSRKNYYQQSAPLSLSLAKFSKPDISPEIQKLLDENAFGEGFAEKFMRTLKPYQPSPRGAQTV